MLNTRDVFKIMQLFHEDFRNFCINITRRASRIREPSRCRCKSRIKVNVPDGNLKNQDLRINQMRLSDKSLPIRLVNIPWHDYTITMTRHESRDLR